MSISDGARARANSKASSSSSEEESKRAASSGADMAAGQGPASDASPALSPAPSASSIDHDHIMCRAEEAPEAALETTVTLDNDATVVAPADAHSPSTRTKPHAPLLDTLAAMASAEALSVERELGRASSPDASVNVDEPSKSANEWASESCRALEACSDSGRMTLVTPHNGSSSSLSHAEAEGVAASSASAEREDELAAMEEKAMGRVPVEGGVQMPMKGADEHRTVEFGKNETAADEENESMANKKSEESSPNERPDRRSKVDAGSRQPKKRETHPPKDVEERSQPSYGFNSTGSQHRYSSHSHHPPYRPWYPSYHVPHPPTHYHPHPCATRSHPHYAPTRPRSSNMGPPPPHYPYPPPHPVQRPHYPYPYPAPYPPTVASAPVMHTPAKKAPKAKEEVGARPVIVTSTPVATMKSVAKDAVEEVEVGNERGEPAGSANAAAKPDEDALPTKPSPKLPPKKRKFQEAQKDGAEVELTASAAESACEKRVSCDRRSPPESPCIEHERADGNREVDEKTFAKEVKVELGPKEEKTPASAGQYYRRHPMHPPHHMYHPPGYYQPPPFAHYPPPPHYHPYPYHYSPSHLRSSPRPSPPPGMRPSTSNVGPRQRSSAETPSTQFTATAQKRREKSSPDSGHDSSPPKRVVADSKVVVKVEKDFESIGTNAVHTEKKSSEGGSSGTQDSTTQPSRSSSVQRCIHIYGSTLVNFVGKYVSECTGGVPSDTASNPSPVSIPSFHQLVNYPEHLPRNSPEKRRKRGSVSNNRALASRNCVMCGINCLFGGNESLSNATVHAASPTSGGDNGDSDASSPSSKSGNAISRTPSTLVQHRQQFTIPRQNKGLCNSCDVKVWLYMPPSDAPTDDAASNSRQNSGQLAIKWCKGCKNFRQWPLAFGEKSRATKCTKCRARQRDKYASTRKN